jgi:hypothetical protein
MDTYVVKLETPRGKLQHKVLAALLFGGTFFVLRFCWSLLSPTSSERNRGPLSLAIEIGVVSLVFGVGMGFFRPRISPNHSYKLFVDQDSITGVAKYTGWMKWLGTRRTVRKGKIRSIFEIKAAVGRSGGIGISERTILGARMMGFVYIPKTLPEYDDLKGLAESWRVTESTN